MLNKSLVEGRSKPFWVLLREYHARVQKGMLGMTDVEVSDPPPPPPKMVSYLESLMIDERIDDGYVSTAASSDPQMNQMVEQILRDASSSDPLKSYPLPPLAHQFRGTFARTTQAYRMRHVVVSILNSNLSAPQPYQPLHIQSGPLVSIPPPASAKPSRKPNTNSKRKSTGVRRPNTKASANAAPVAAIDDVFIPISPQ
jgi:hypothetical protein